MSARFVACLIVLSPWACGSDLGIDYHATGADFGSTAFVNAYDKPGVREEVRKQLADMAERGISRVSTRLWLVTDPGKSDFGQVWRSEFPLSELQQAHLREYAKDVAAVVTSRGERLRLDLCLLWLGAAQYSVGTPEEGLGSAKLPAEEFLDRARTSTDRLLAAVKDVKRPDGVSVVDKIYLDGEVNTFGRPNQGWFLNRLYPEFVRKTKAAGLEPSVYFIMVNPAQQVMDDSYRDSEYSVLDGRRPLFHIYRTLRYMVENKLPIPKRIDFSCYIQPDSRWSEGEVLTRILNDTDTALADLGIKAPYGFAETAYPADPVRRRALGQALANEMAHGKRLEMVSFWTTPDAGGKGHHFGWPFVIEDYLPDTTAEE